MPTLAPARSAARTRTSSAPGGALLATAALVALIGTGCSNAPAATGGSSGSNATAATPDATPSPDLLEERREFATCMRENGVEDFPDPDPAKGGFVYYGDDPDMKAAHEKCGDLPGGDDGQQSGSGG